MNRVALVTHDLSRGGGVATVVRFLYEVLLADSGYEPSIVSLATSSSDEASVRITAPRSWRRGVRVVEREFDEMPYLHVGAVGAELEFQRYRPRRALTELLSHVDLVQIVAGLPSWALTVGDSKAPTALQMATLAGMERASRQAGGDGVLSAWRRFMTRITSRSDDRALRSVDSIFVENQHIFRIVRAMAPESRVLLAPPGIDTDLFTPDGSGGGDYVLWVGRALDQRKNLGLFLEAVERIDAQARPQVVIAGPTDLPGRYLSRARALGAEIVVGASRQDLAELYRRAALLAVSSDEEGLGMVMLEAMASGVPSVATRTHGAEMAVLDGTTGILVPVRDGGALAAAIQHLLLDEDQRQRMGTAARARALAEFSLEVAARPFLDTYRSLLGTGN